MIAARDEEAVATEAYASIGTVRRIGGTSVLLTAEAPASPMLNRVVGLGSDTPATEEALDAALDAVPLGTRFYVSLAPAAEPAELAVWLAARGLEPGWSWMGFRRAPHDPPDPGTGLGCSAASGADEKAAFARIVRIGYDLPVAAERAIKRAFTAGWECMLAREHDEPVGAAALYAHGSAAYLGFAATLPDHRGKGAQGGLLSARIRRAGELGCTTVTSETGELREGYPASSYRNLLEAGFEETALTTNWVGER